MPVYHPTPIANTAVPRAPGREDQFSREGVYRSDMTGAIITAFFTGGAFALVALTIIVVIWNLRKRIKHKIQLAMKWKNRREGRDKNGGLEVVVDGGFVNRARRNVLPRALDPQERPPPNYYLRDDGGLVSVPVFHAGGNPEEMPPPNYYLRELYGSAVSVPVSHAGGNPDGGV